MLSRWRIGHGTGAMARYVALTLGRPSPKLAQLLPERGTALARPNWRSRECDVPGVRRKMTQVITSARTAAPGLRWPARAVAPRLRRGRSSADHAGQLLPRHQRGDSTASSPTPQASRPEDPHFEGRPRR